MGRSPENWERIKALFEGALECEPRRRSDYLREQGADQTVRDEVIRLLVEHDKADGFLSSPAYENLQPQPPTPESRFIPGAILAGRFKIIRFIAAGGMGEVYEAQDLELHEDVAIKTIRQDVLEQPNALARFRREVHLARKVTHPNVCRVFDLFKNVPAARSTDREATFVSMELLRGETLKQLIRRSGCFSTRQALPLIVQICSGLGAAHHAGVVHRDFKPGNVVLVPEGESGNMRAVITDFGLAFGSGADASVSSDLSTAQGVMGTPAYMAPEQIQGGKITPAVDIYALGLVMFEMVAGKMPFAGESPISIALRRVQDEAPSPRLFMPTLGAAWDGTIRRCLEREPSKRFGMADEVARALAGDAEYPVGRLVALSKPRILIPGMAVLLALGVGSGAYISRHRKSAEAGKAVTTSTVKLRPAVAVIGFKNLTGRPSEEWISTALSETLTTEISAGGKLRTIPDENIAQMKINISLQDEDSYGPETLTKIRKNTGSDYVVLGSFLTQGKDEIRLDLRLEDADTGELIDSFSIRGSAAAIDDLVSRAGAEVRGRLGVEELTPGEAAGVRASQSWNPEATRLYSAGLVKLRAFDIMGARDLLQDAIIADPKFALAHSALGQAWFALGFDQRAGEEAKRAFDLSAAFPKEDRLWIEGRYRETTYEWDKAIDVYRSLWASAPDNIDYGLRLAQVQILASRGKDAMTTVSGLRQLPAPARDDARIDLIEAIALESLGDFKQAQHTAELSAMKAEANGARLLAARAWIRECSDLQNLGDSSQANAVCEEARQAFESAGDRNGVANALNVLANELAEEGDIAGAKHMYGEALVEYRKTGNRNQEAWALNNIGTLTREQGDYAASIKQHEEALTIFRETDSRGAIGTSYTNLAINFKMVGNAAKSREFFEKALSIQREVGDKRRVSLIQNNLAILLFEQGDLTGAKTAADDALLTARQIGSKGLASDAISHVAAVLRAQDHLALARETAEQQLGIEKELGRKGRFAQTQIQLALLSDDQGQPGVGEALARKATEEFHYENLLDWELTSRAIIIQSLLAEGKKEEARTEIQQALSASSNNKLRNVDLAVAAARGEAFLDCRPDAHKILESYLFESTKHGNVSDQFEIRSALAEIEMKCGQNELGRVHLSALENDARSRGFLLVARKAKEISVPN